MLPQRNASFMLAFFLCGKVKPTNYQIMPCDHKFINDLDLERLDFELSTLIVGTFHPSWPENNNVKWFYGPIRDAEGRRINDFWDVLPRLYGERRLIDADPAEWKQFCHDKRIAITGLIRSIEDADPGNKEHIKILAGGDDKAIVYHFDDFIFTDILSILRKNPGIKNVYLTRGVTESFWRHIWTPVMQYCKQNNIHERRLMTPTTVSHYHHEAYNKENPDKAIPLFEDYILMRWGQEWHF